MIAPILMIKLEHTSIIYVRFFLISMVFYLILISFLLARIYQGSRVGKAFCLLFLAGYILANGRHMMTLFRHGRGHYDEAARFMAGHTKGSLVTIGSDQDFRIPLILWFYTPQSMAGKTAEYFPNNSWRKEGPGMDCLPEGVL